MNSLACSTEQKLFNALYLYYIKEFSNNFYIDLIKIEIQYMQIGHF